ncbi:MAG: hypothetical protein U0401_15695 [Anaerolineae bacterium]
MTAELSACPRLWVDPNTAPYTAKKALLDTSKRLFSPPGQRPGESHQRTAAGHAE